VGRICWRVHSTRYGSSSEACRCMFGYNGRVDACVLAARCTTWCGWWGVCYCVCSTRYGRSSEAHGCTVVWVLCRSCGRRQLEYFAYLACCLRMCLECVVCAGCGSFGMLCLGSMRRICMLHGKGHETWCVFALRESVKATRRFSRKSIHKEAVCGGGALPD
jgi:hypothetical protein